MSHHHGHSHDSCGAHEEEKSCCGCSCCSCECQVCQKHHHHHHHEHGDFAHQLLEMADDAWMEVLKDKIKAQIMATNGARLDKLAKLVADSNNTRWKHKLADKKGSGDYEAKIAEFFSQE